MVGCPSNLEPHRTDLNLCKFSFLLSLKGLCRSCGKAGHVARNCPSGAWIRLRAGNAAERDTERSADPTSAEAQYLGASVSGLPSRATSAYTEGVAEPGVGVVVLLYQVWPGGKPPVLMGSPWSFTCIFGISWVII